MSETTSTRSQAKLRARNAVPERVDVAIVGAGLGGLTAGAYLARAGLKVAIFDPHYVAGGCATVFTRGTGPGRYQFDIGLHYIGDCEPHGMIPSLLRGIGVELEYLPLDRDGFDTLVFPDLRFKIPVDIGLYRDRLVALFPSERRGIDKYVRFVRELGQVSRRVDANHGRITPGVLLYTLFRGRSIPLNQTRTLAQLLDGCTREPKLRAILAGQGGDYGLPPSEVSAMLHAGLAAHYFRGAYYPKGGGQVIADRIAETVEAAGSTIHLRCGIDEILVEGGRAVGVRTEPRRGEVYEVRADVVISNADIKKTLLELLPADAVPEPWQERARGFVMGGAIFLTFLGVERDMAAAGMRAANYWCFDGYDMEHFYAANRGSTEVVPQGCYITSATLKDPDTAHHAPPGINNLEVMTIVPGDAATWKVPSGDVAKWRYKRDEEYRDLKKRIEDNLVDRLEALFPGTREKIVYRESASPVTHTRYTRASGGTGYGLAATPDQFLKKRPGYRGPVDRLYFAGASTQAGHGIVGSMASGFYSALRVGRDLERPLTS